MAQRVADSMEAVEDDVKAPRLTPDEPLFPRRVSSQRRPDTLDSRPGPLDAVSYRASFFSIRNN
jgi:hypothetical protein